jgi:hypothetical protein
VHLAGASFLAPAQTRFLCRKAETALKTGDNVRILKTGWLAFGINLQVADRDILAGLNGAMMTTFVRPV